LSLGRAATLGLYGMDGRVVLRQPAPQQIIGKTIAGGPLLAAVAQAPNGLVSGISRLDGVERLIAYRSLPEFGTIVAVAIDIDEIMAEWQRSALLVITLLVMACAGIAAMARVTFRALVHEEKVIQGLEQTVRERTDEAHRQATEAHRANHSKTRFLAAASHDLRQPLQAAGMFVEALAVRLADSPNAPIVDKLRQSVDATQTLLTTLLDASTLEAGQIEPAIITFPMEPQAAAAGLRLKFVASSARIVSDPVLLERMLRNLLVNALRYTPKGKVLLGCHPHGDRLTICVIDTGIGISAGQLEAIFEDFTRLGDKGDAAHHGLGLGLGVVRRMADLLGHEVIVRSVVGKGSCFAITLPRKQ
jgi:signal transduction histidine kinase